MADHGSDQTAVARAIAQETAALMRATAVESRLGIPLNGDMLFGFRRVLLKLGGEKSLSSAGQKALQALPIAYSAVSVKEAGQMNGTARDSQMTKTLMEFAIPNFLLLLTAAAKQLDLPLPSEVHDKIFKTTLGTGTCWPWLPERSSVDVSLACGVVKKDGPKNGIFFSSLGRVSSAVPAPTSYTYMLCCACCLVVCKVSAASGRLVRVQKR